MQIFMVGLVILLMWAPNVFGTAFGTTGQNFLTIGVGARPTAMGGAFVGLADDPDAIHWNPAGLINLEDYEISLMHSALIGDVSYDTVSYAQPIAVDYGYIGAGIAYLGVPPFDNTVGRENSISAHNFLLDIAYANRLSDMFDIGNPIGRRLSLGLGIKWINFSIDNLVSYNDVAFDVGTYFITPWEPLTLGASLQNLGISLDPAAVSDPLPLTFRCGACVHIADLSMQLDLIQQVDNDAVIGWGTEYNFQDLLFLRGGYAIGGPSLNGLSGITCGAGWRMRSFEFDYTFVPMGELGATHRFSLNVSFEQELKELRKNLAVESKDKVQKDEIIALYKKGNEFYYQGNYTQALDAWQQILIVDPKNQKAQERITFTTNLLNKKFTENEATQYYEQGMSDYSAGDYEKALEQWASVQKIVPDYLNIKEMISKAEAKLAEKRVDRAGVGPLLEAARTSYKQGQLLDAVKDWRKVLEANPQNQEALKSLKDANAEILNLAKKTYDKGLEFYTNGDYDNAIATWKNVVILQPDHPTVLGDIERAQKEVNSLKK